MGSRGFQVWLQSGVHLTLSLQPSGGRHLEAREAHHQAGQRWVLDGEADFQKVEDLANVL
jgi:hypothetical protein